jgi:hypothetical protein
MILKHFSFAKATIAAAFGLFIGFSPKSQIQIQPYGTGINEQSMVIDFLLGTGVLVSNVTATGQYYYQTGAFTDPNSTLGMSSGIAMSTGLVAGLQIGGPSGSCCGGVFGGSGNEDLYFVANETFQLLGMTNYTVPAVYDIVALEFDFIPLGDNISFNYLFASNEYLQYVNSPFNDVFGFFLSGPGIEGPYSAPAGFPGGSVNIATVPNTNPALPITVSSVHPGLNSQYYVHNIPNMNIKLNGRTTVFTASYSGLIAGETYHIRLALADASDAVLDTAVLLEAGSFTSEVPANGNLADFNGDGVINYLDLIIILSDMNCVSPPACIGDLNGDGTTSFSDIVIFLELFGIVVGG